MCLIVAILFGFSLIPKQATNRLDIVRPLSCLRPATIGLAG